MGSIWTTLNSVKNRNYKYTLSDLFLYSVAKKVRTVFSNLMWALKSRNLIFNKVNYIKIFNLYYKKVWSANSTWKSFRKKKIHLLKVRIRLIFDPKLFPFKLYLQIFDWNSWKHFKYRIFRVNIILQMF